MIKIVISALLLSSISQAGMFDSIANNVSDASSLIAPQQTTSGGIVSSITNSLGVSPTQATGGTAAIMQYVKSQTSASDFSSLTKSVPGLSDMGSNSIVSDVTSSINTANDVTSAFNTLGLDASMVKQFVPVIKNYIVNSGGESSKTVISALSSLM